MDNELISTGKKIYISFEDSKIDKFKYASQIIDIFSETEVIILSPFFMGNSFRLTFGQMISILIMNENGLNVFSAKIAEEIIENNLIMYKLKLSIKPERFQRRNYFRLSVEISIVYVYCIDEDEFYGQGKTFDISGGGVRFICSEELKSGDNIKIIIKIDEGTQFLSNSRIIRCSEVGIKKYEICTQFTDISQSMRDEIIKFIFNIQRQELRKKNN